MTDTDLCSYVNWINQSGGSFSKIQLVKGKTSKWNLPRVFGSLMNCSLLFTHLTGMSLWRRGWERTKCFCNGNDPDQWFICYHSFSIGDHWTCGTSSFPRSWRLLLPYCDVSVCGPPKIPWIVLLCTLSQYSTHRYQNALLLWQQWHEIPGTHQSSAGGQGKVRKPTSSIWTANGIS